MSIPKKVITLSNSMSVLDSVLNDFEASIVSTLGPLGKTVVITSEDSIVPHVTKDGVTVAESIYYADPFKNGIAALIKEAARKTSEEVGDGTTTSILLAITLIKESLKNSVLVSNPRRYLEGIDKAIDFVIEYLQDETKEVEMGSKEIKGVINISSNNDPDITSLLLSVTEQIGPHGILDVKVGDSLINRVEIFEGASIDSNVVAKPGTKTFEWNVTANVVLVEGKIDTVLEIKDILTDAARTQIPVVIVAKEFSEAVKSNINVNNAKKALSCVLVEAEGFGNSRIEILKDLAAVTGAKVLSTDGSTEYPLRSYNSDMSGIVSGFVASDRHVVLYCNELNLELESTKARKLALINDYANQEDRTGNSLYRRRLAKYVKVATILVGGSTKAAALEAKDRIDDAVAAVSSAVNSGVLPGGGSALYRAISILEGRKDQFSIGSEEHGRQVVLKLCAEPIKRLSLNSGYAIPEKALKEVLEGPNKAYNILEEKVVDAYKNGILDPALVLIKALTNAAAVNKSIINSGAFIVNDEV